MKNRLRKELEAMLELHTGDSFTADNVHTLVNGIFAADEGGFEFVEYDNNAFPYPQTIGDTTRSIEGLGSANEKMIHTIFIMPNKETDSTATMMIIVDEVEPDSDNYQYVYVGNINDLPSDVLTEGSIVNDLTSGGTSKPLSAEQGRTLNSHVNYTTCGSNEGDQVKLIPDDGFELSTNLRLLVKMTNTNTNSTPKFNINNTGVKDVWYNGSVASDTNTWSAGEVLDVYYDGINYVASTHGGARFATGEVVDGIGIDDEPTTNSNNLVKSGGIKNQFNSLYSITTNILEDVSFTVGRVVSGHVYSQYTEWKYLKFNAIKGDIITYRAQCNNAIILGKYYSDSNVVTIVTGTSDNVVNGTYTVLENGTYTFCVYSSYNDSILTKTSKGDIQTLLDESARKTDLNDYNISIHQTNSDSTSPRYNTNLFTLEEAIAQVPVEYQHGGLRLTFFQENTPPLVYTYTLNTKNWSNNITYWVNDVNGTYSKIIDILNQATFQEGRVIDNRVYTHYTDWKYFIFDAKEGDIIFYRSSCGNAYVLGRYYSNTNITMLVDGNTSTIVTGTYVIPATGKYTFCKYSSYNSPILRTKTAGDIPILQEKVENLEDTVVKSSELEEKPVVYTNSILTSIKNKVDLANTFIKKLELIDVPDYSEGQLVIGQMYFYGRTSSAIRWINRIMLRQNGSTTWQYDFEINLFEAPTTEFKTITKTHVKVTWDLYNLYAYRNQVSAENGFALNYTDTSDQYPYILRNYPETAPEKLISGRCIEDDSLNEEKLSASVRTKLNSAGNYINLLENKKIVSLGDSLSVSGVWQEVLVDRCKSIFDSTKNSYLSVGGTKTLDLTNTCGQRRAKKLVEDSGIVPDYIFIENVNDYIITPPPYHNTPTDINDEPFFLTTIYEVGTTFNNKSQATTYFTNNFNQLTTDFDAVKGGAIKLPYNTVQFNLTVANAPTSSGSFTVVTSNGESKSIACTGSETIEQVVNKIAEYSFEGWVVTKVSSSVVSFVPEDSTYTLSITDNTTGVVINITSSTSTYYVDKYFCSVDVANWTKSSYWKNHPGLYASYKGLVEYLQNNFPLANIIILIPEAFQLNYNAQQYKRPDGTRNVDALYSYDYLGYLYNIQISFAERYRLRIIDLRGKCGINYINIQDFQPINNVHPYDSGYRRWGEEIVREIA